MEAEHQLGRLMNLYVATFQLHATLDPTEVQATIAEIAVDLLGAERFVLLLRSEGTNECEVALSRGLEQDPSGLYAREKYLGGDPLVDAALEDGVLRMGPDEFSDVIAAVPLAGPGRHRRRPGGAQALRPQERSCGRRIATCSTCSRPTPRRRCSRPASTPIPTASCRTLESLVQLVRST